MSAFDHYSSTVQNQITAICSTQRGGIEQAAAWLGEALANDRGLYAFGTGHSHMMAEEIFYRAGGLAHAVPLLDTKLMLHENASQSTEVERQEGYAGTLLKRYPVVAGDVLLIASNSGRNAVPIELALAARKLGMKTVAITNFAHARDWPSRHSSGKNLAAVADLAIDNCGVSGDACVFSDAWVFGDARVFGEARVSGDARVHGDAQIAWFSKVGSSRETLTVYTNIDGGITLTRGCFIGTLEEFETAVNERHGQNRYGNEYLALIAFIRLRFDYPEKSTTEAK